MKIILIQIWIGPIPNYFWYHYETTKNLNIDFLFVTDQDIVLNSKNYKVFKMTKTDIESKLSNILKVDFKIKNNKKICDLKASFGHMFEEYISEYDYFGCYDIDTLFGDTEKYLTEYLGEYDFVSIGDDKIHNRLSGPFLIIRNIKELRELYIGKDFISCFDNENVECFEEHVISNIAKSKYKVKLIDSSNFNLENGGKNEYNCMWSGGKVFINNEEKFIYHFIRKKHTKFFKVGNQIFGRYDKVIVDDFYWVFGFTENYSKTIEFLMDSINKYSNRKCVIYTINFDYYIPKKYLTSEQFIFRRINIEEGKKDQKGRDENVINLKPKLMLDVIMFLPNKKFVFIDSDVYLTVSCDDISQYLNKIEHYPLINQHVHDRLYLLNIVDGEEWTSTVDILAKEDNVEINIFPRRKTNVMVFDEKSKWFFQQQISMYEQYKDTKPGIFTLHDEDSANVILSKYRLNKSLHLCDIEECSNVDLHKYTDTNHPFHMTGLSSFLIKPKNQNDIFCFHGLKTKKQYKNIENDYNNSVIDCEEILVYYENNTIFFEKNSFLTTKKIDENVDLIVKNKNGKIIEILENQNLFNYWLFFISNVLLTEDYYIIEIVKTNSKIKIYNNILKT